MPQYSLIQIYTGHVDSFFLSLMIIAVNPTFVLVKFSKFSTYHASIRPIRKVSDANCKLHADWTRDPMTSSDPFSQPIRSGLSDCSGRRPQICFWRTIFILVCLTIKYSSNGFLWLTYISLRIYSYK